MLSGAETVEQATCRLVEKASLAVICFALACGFETEPADVEREEVVRAAALLWPWLRN
jgi:hypothetical protein